MWTRLRHVVALPLVILGVLSATSAQERGGRAADRRTELGEPRDIALRRLQALHDMYGSDEDAGTYEKRRAASAVEAGGPRRPRPLPVNYSGRNVEYRLNLLRQERGPRLPGRMIKPQASPLAGKVWQNLGPTNTAGRVSALDIDPTNPLVIYRGTAGGGVWKTTNGGTTWAPLTDNLGNLSIGAIAVAPSQPATVYVGTGEGALGIDGIDGLGLIKSTDGGATWNLPVSLSATKFFGLSVHPARPDELLAATSVGIQKSTDGGVTWTTTFSKHAGTELLRMPDNPATVLATTWDISSSSPTWNGFVYRSIDGGDTWAEAAKPGGAPFPGDLGRLSVAIAPSAPQTVYLLAATASGDAKNCQDDPVDQLGFYRSTDGGLTWAFRSNPVTGSCFSGFDSILAAQGWYANSVRVSKADPAVLYAGGLDVWKSTDGAMTWTKKSRWDLAPSNPRYVHADTHVLLWAGNRLLVGNDGGIDLTIDGGTSFSGLNQGAVTRQYYGVATSAANRDMIIGGAQDNGTDVRIGSTSTFREVIGGDGFAVALHPTDPNIMYGTVYASRVFRSMDSGVTFDEITPNFDRAEKRPFISPLTMDPLNPSILYTGSNFLWKTADGGASWARTSATDLGDGRRRGYVTKIAVARTDTKQILTATGGGVVKKSTDGGASWTTIQGLPARYASHVEMDPADARTFYVSFINPGPGGRLFKTTDDGATLSQIDQGLPQFPIHVLRVDPANSTVLYAGTDVGLYRSTDGGTNWARFGPGLPAVSIWDLAIAADGTIVAATHGRGFYELKGAASPTSRRRKQT